MKTLCVKIGKSYCRPIKRTIEIAEECKKFFIGNPIAYEDLNGKIDTCDISDIIEVDLSSEKKNRYCYKIKEV